MAAAKKQNLDTDTPTPQQHRVEKPNQKLFDQGYYQARKEQERLQYLKDRDQAAYYQEMERRRLRDKLLLDIKIYLEKSADISLVEKKEILGLVKKFTVQELTSLLDKIVKDGLKEGLAVIKGQQKFLKGTSGKD